MRGRYELNETPARLGSRYRVEPGDLDFAQNADVRPTDTNPVILLHDGRRIASIESGASSRSGRKIRRQSARRSTLGQKKPTRSRCSAVRSSRSGAFPTTAFFEWQAIESQKKKRKIRISRADGDMLTLAGLHDYWRRGDDVLETFTILTTAPNVIMEPIHNLMPVILAEADEDEWLDSATSVATARAMCMPCPSEWLTVAPTF